jgi:hypothetical protein
MYPTPGLAAFGQRQRDLFAEFVEVREVPIPFAIPEFHGPFRTVQSKSRLASLAENVHVRWRMIIRIDGHSISLSAPEDGRHANVIAET